MEGPLERVLHTVIATARRLIAVERHDGSFDLPFR